MQPRTMVRLIAVARAGFGALLTLRTTQVLRTIVKDAEPTGSLWLFALTVGTRDLVLGVGTLLASFNEESDLTRWVKVCLASDTIDTVAGASSARHVGLPGSLMATAASIPFVAGGAWALRHLHELPSPA